MSHAKRSYSQVNRKILSEQEFVKLSQTSYPNVKFDSDGTQNDILLKQFLDDLQSAAAAANVIVGITTAKTGHSERATSGAVSRHTKGAAVDITKFNGIDSGKATGPNDGNREFKKLGDKFVAELGKLGYNRVQGEYPSVKKSILWQTSKGGNHYNHVHVSNITKLSNVGQPDLENKTTNTMNEVEIENLWNAIKSKIPFQVTLAEFKEYLNTPEKRKKFFNSQSARLGRYGISMPQSEQEFEAKYGPQNNTSAGGESLLDKMRDLLNSGSSLSAARDSLAQGASNLAGGAMNLFGGLGTFLGNLGAQGGDWLKALNISDLTNTTVAKKGDKNEDVKNIQRYLKSQGYNDIVPDGDFGNATEKAIKDFQQKNKLDPSGIVNLPTYDMLTRGGKVTIKYINPNDF